MSFLAELKRRNVIRMAAVYVVVAWLIMQVAEVVIGLASLPDWIGKGLLAILAIGFPIALVFAWIYEVTPEGLKLEKNVDRTVSITADTGRRMNFVIIAILMAAVILFAADKWWLSVEKETSAPNPNSIAVLAFANMSGDEGQEFFSDGISEELLNLLAKIPELQVISRTSAFSYKGKDATLPDIAHALNVANILEGSVRMAGDRVRVTVQLIETASDTHLWSETYDRDLDDIFAIQDDIAGEVVDRLRITMLGDRPSARDTDPEAYALYLHARFLMRQGTPESLREAEAKAKQALEIDDRYVPAWTLLGSIYSNQVSIDMVTEEEGFAKGEQAARRAIEIDPGYAMGHARLGWIARWRHGDFQKAADHYSRAMRAQPTLDINGAAQLLVILQRSDEGLAMLERIANNDPANSVAQYNLGVSRYLAGDLAGAKERFEKTLSISPNFVGARFNLAQVELFLGNLESALTLLESEPDDEWRTKGKAIVFFAMGRTEEADVELQALEKGWGDRWPSEVAQVYAFRGEIDKAFEWLDRESQMGDGGGWGEGRYDPLLVKLHEDPRWQAFLEDRGVSDEQLAKIVIDVPQPR